MYSLRAFTLLLLGALLTTACPPTDEPGEGEGEDDPIETTLSDFVACDESLAPPGLGIECATLTMQLDPGDASAGPIDLSVMRWSAFGDPSERRGVMAMHPGGPGLSPLVALPGFVFLLDINVPEVHRAYDIVAIDSPGTAFSSPIISCAADAVNAYIDAMLTPMAGADGEARDNVEATARAVAASCLEQSGPALLAQVGAGGAARALDELRAALGEDELSFYGTSYGTLVGAAYASLYPDRVGKIVLDSNMPLDANSAFLQSQSYEASERHLDAFFSWCASTTTCAFHVADGDASDVAAAYDALLAEARDHADGSDIVLRSSLLPLFLRAGWRALAGTLAIGPPGPLSSATAEPPPDAVAHIAIAAIDEGAASGLGGDVAAYLDAIAATQAAHPRVVFPMQLAGIVWPDPVLSAMVPVSYGAPTAPAILVVGGTLDPVTHTDNTEPMRAAIGASSLKVEYEGPGHSQLASVCVAHAVADFIFADDGAPPALPARCASEKFVVDDAPAGSIDALFAIDDTTTRVGESALGNFIADTMRAAAGTSVAISNAGAMARGTSLPSGVVVAGRDTSAAGPFALVVGDWYEALPFGGAVVTRTLTPALLFAVLESGVSALPAPSNQLVMASGFRYTFDVTQPVGSRIVSVELDDGTLLDRADETTFIDAAIDSFMTGGGGGDFGMLFGEPVELVDNMAALCAQAAEQLGGALPSTTDGRIVSQ